MATQREAIARESVGRILLRRVNLQRQGVVGVLVALIIFTSLTSDVFLTPNNLLNVLRQVAILGIVASGMTVVMVSGGIDLSVGSAISLAGCLAGKAMVAEYGIAVAVLVGLGTGALIGLMNGAIVAYSRAHPFIITLGTMTLIQGVALLATNSYPVLASTPQFKRFGWLGSGNILRVPVPVIALFAVLLLCYILLRSTRFGRHSYAVGGSEATAYLAGINVRRHKMLVYTFNGALVGLASLVLTARIASALPNMGNGYELQSIAAVVIGGVALVGGRGGMWAAFTGVLLLGVISNSLSLLNVNAFYQYVVLGSIIVFAVVLQEARK